ncbi:hypothetical protein ABTY53_17605 [Streptomyces noursei]
MTWAPAAPSAAGRPAPDRRALPHDEADLAADQATLAATPGGTR